MENIVEMQTQRADLAKAMRNLVEKVDAKVGMTSEQEAQWSEMDGKLSNLDKSIAAAEKLQDIENSLSQIDVPARRSQPAAAKNQNPLASDDYTNAFDSFARNGLSTDVRGALSVGTDAEGGFVVPETWATTLINKLTDNVVMRQLATVTTMSHDRNLPIVTDNGTAAWIDEKAAYPESDVAFGNMKLQAWKLGRIMKVSEELLQDSMINLPAELARIFALTFGTAAEAAYVGGDGTKKPTGVLVDAANGVTAASTTGVTYDEVLNLIHSVRQVYRGRSQFLMADATCANLRKLKSADGIPLWQPSLQAGSPDRFLGYGVNTTEAVPAATAGNKSIAFGDFSEYRIADRSGIVMQRLDEKYADEGLIGFKSRMRTDGKLAVAEAVKTLTQAAS